MTSVTYGHGFLDDMTAATLASWVETESGLVCAATNLYNDYLQLYGTLDNAGDEYATYERDITNRSTDTYTKYLVRWRTSASAAPGCQLKIVFVFTDSSQEVTLGFSSAWTVSSGTVTAGKTLDKIRLILDDNPDSLADGQYWAQVDYVLICKNQFTFPNTAHRLRYTPPPRYAITGIPSRIGDNIQNLGSKSAEVSVSCDLDVGDWKRTGDTINGEVFDDISHNSYAEPWQWLDFAHRQFKAVMEDPVFNYEEKHFLDLSFLEYRKSTGTNETYAERFGIH